MNFFYYICRFSPPYIDNFFFRATRLASFVSTPTKNDSILAFLDSKYYKFFKMLPANSFPLKIRFFSTESLVLKSGLEHLLPDPNSVIVVYENPGIDMISCLYGEPVEGNVGDIISHIMGVITKICPVPSAGNTRYNIPHIKEPYAVIKFRNKRLKTSWVLILYGSKYVLHKLYAIGELIVISDVNIIMRQVVKSTNSEMIIVECCNKSMTFCIPSMYHLRDEDEYYESIYDEEDCSEETFEHGITNHVELNRVTLMGFFEGIKDTVIIKACVLKRLCYIKVCFKFIENRKFKHKMYSFSG